MTGIDILLCVIAGYGLHDVWSALRMHFARKRLYHVSKRPDIDTLTPEEDWAIECMFNAIKRDMSVRKSAGLMIMAAYYVQLNLGSDPKLKRLVDAKIAELTREYNK
jgi:hypothetical protein